LVPDDASYLSRFTVKFVEITAAGVATAISGYAIAHVAGYFSQPAPVVIQPVPAISAVAKPPARNVLSARPVPARVEAKGETKAEGKGESRAEAKAESKVEAKTEPKSEAKAEPKTEAKAEPKTEPKTEPKAEAKAEPPQQAANPAPSQSAKAAATATQAPQRKPVTAEATATESKPRDTLSVEAEVRAALAKVDASRPAHADSRPEQAAASPVPVVREVQPLQQEAQPLPVDDTVGTVAAVPRGPEAIPETAKQVLAPPDAPPLDIKSLPVATVEAAPPAAPDEPAPKKSGGGIFSVIKNFPDMLRSDGHEPSRDAPRPPMPVGE
jgi:hypothetical protein